MRINCGKTWEEKRARLEQWHYFFPLLPRFVPGIGYIWLETIERKGSYWEGNWAGGEGWNWEYRSEE